MPLGLKKGSGKKTKIKLRRPEAKKVSKEQFDEPVMDPEEIVRIGLDTANRLGLKLPKRPMTTDGEPIEPNFPANMTDCTSEELGELLGQYSAMAGYALGQLALIDTRHTITGNNEKIAKTLRYLAEDGSIKNREAKALASHEAFVRSVAYHQRRAEQKILSAVFEGYIHNHATISREISRRERASEGRESD